MTQRTVLRWHGGKSKLASWIIGHLTHSRVFVEPYGGAASVLMNKARVRHEVYNDLDSQASNLFKILRDRKDELQRVLSFTPFSRDEYIAAFESADDPLESARRMLVRSAFGRYSAAATCKYKSNFKNYTGEGRRTNSSQDWSSYPSAIPDFAERLRGVIIENKPAIEVIKEHDSPTTLFYVDPPYPAETRDKLEDYRHEMTFQDHQELSDCLHSVKGMVAISGYDCEQYRTLYGGWRCERARAFADNAIEREECLWLSPNIPSNTLF